MTSSISPVFPVNPFVFDVKTKKIVAQDRGHYLALPGGGLDSGENPLTAGRREIKEEVGGHVKKLKILLEIKWDWYPAWADTPKRKKRYKKSPISVAKWGIFFRKG